MLCVCVHFKDLHNKFFKKKKNPRGKEGERERFPGMFPALTDF